ncbi:P-loop containing nucleoside triphosphate hydrolase protein [Desarmillaria tabescens]|uniref:RNA helicase n=1 Tax=Armillaria tabescens TaxID=1929756 RepID=A0AA39TZA4_ARMTA|nr:P-loop containing nucleoside triphosphate hydrolase protein [Desarmillaria tabescens]KAK0467369.1 P-loop containing nucleoside triphosphate hydrolase protein [Desarmillaria tabescens]
MGFARPTLVQAKAIPLALESKDILARAQTGSGKTAAYLHTHRTEDTQCKKEDVSYQATRALILVPTRELAQQVCEKEITCVNISAGTTSHLQRTLLSDKPDIVVATPTRALVLLQSKFSSRCFGALESLVCEESLAIRMYLPKSISIILMSATMTEDVELLKGLTLRSPAILKLEQGEDEAANLTQYSVKCSEVDKFLLTYVILKLKLIKGKCILFVNDVDRSYRLKLFLEQFSIKSCVLNSELPLNSRYHTVQEFNKGVYDYIIATDESGTHGADQDSEDDGDDDDDDDDDEEEEEEEPNDKNEEAEQQFTSTQRELKPSSEEPPAAIGSSSSLHKRKRSSPEPSQKPRKRRSRKDGGDKEYGVTRGIDFVDVACVLNFDLPGSSRSYTHRIGRTARAGRTGMSLSFVVPQDQWGKNKVVGCLPSAKRDVTIFERIEQEQAARGSKIKDYVFDMKQVEAFRYRMEDALRSVTRTAIREARMKELKTEILNSDKLKAHFEDNPLDLEYLRHDKVLHPTRIQPHMKHVPKYLLPRVAPVNGTAEGETTADKSTGSRHRGRWSGTRGGDRGGRKKSDPLKKFGR